MIKSTPDVHREESVIKSHTPTGPENIWYAMLEGVLKASFFLQTSRDAL